LRAFIFPGLLQAKPLDVIAGGSAVRGLIYFRFDMGAAALVCSCIKSRSRKTDTHKGYPCPLPLRLWVLSPQLHTLSKLVSSTGFPALVKKSGSAGVQLFPG
jgi:hypothetical protein